MISCSNDTISYAYRNLLRIHVSLSYLVHVKIYNYPEKTKHIKIFFWLTGHSRTLWNHLSTIARYRFFDSSEIKKKNHNQEAWRDFKKFKPRKILIKMICSLNKHEKRMCGCRLHTLIIILIHRLFSRFIPCQI